jgi:ribosomal protein S18 acetylase RimI-like enzyme
MRIIKYSNQIFESIAPLLREGTQRWGKEWREEIFRIYSQGEGEAHVAEDDGRIIGTIFLKRYVRVLVIYFLAVAKKERMKEVGSALVELAEKIARNEGRILRVDVAKEFEKNANFYTKRGFKKCGRVKNFYMYGDEQIFLFKKPKR